MVGSNVPYMRPNKTEDLSAYKMTCAHKIPDLFTLFVVLDYQWAEENLIAEHADSDQNRREREWTSQKDHISSYRELEVPLVTTLIYPAHALANPNLPTPSYEFLQALTLFAA
jgi:hypothetical protein